MIRIFKLVVLLVISQVAFGQAPSNYVNINGRYRWIAGMFDSTFHIPKGTTPSLRTGGSTNSGGLFYNTSDSSVYTYTGTQWIKLRGSINPSDTTNKYVTQVYKKNASDSVFYVKGGNHLFAFIDSVGSPGGGGGGKIYYLNGGVSMGTFGGFQMYELGDTANTGAAANFTRATTGNLANFITDPNKPGLLQIPAGVWTMDAWLSETGGGANHAEIWIEVEKWDGSTITTIATSPIEQITEGSTPNLYTWSVSIPTTALTVTDRIIIQFYITNTNGKTVTLYTQNGYVGEVHTTFTTGIGAINGLTAPAQYLVTGTSGTDFNINSSTATHTFNLPTASATNRGALSSTDWTTFNNKQNALTLTTTGTSGAATLVGATLNIPQYQGVLTNPVTGTGTTNYIPKFTSSSAIGNSIMYEGTNAIGIGTTSPTGKLTVNTGTNENLSIVTGGSGDLRIAALNDAASSTVQLSIQGSPLLFRIAGGLEAMRLDASGNLYLNTTSGTGRLVIAQSNATQPAITLTTDESTIQGPSANTKILMGGNLSMYGANILTFGTGTTERARIDASGNLGLGVTPSAWGSNVRALQLGARMSVYNDGSNNALFGNNTYFNGSDNYYINTAPAARFYIENTGTFIWQQAPSGTAGNAISFTQAMTLDASGRLGIGVTNPSGLLQLNGSIATSGDAATFTIKQSSTTYTNGIYLERGGERNGYYMYIGGGSDALTFRRNYFGTQSDVMSLTRDGNVGIGTTSPTSLFTVAATGSDPVLISNSGASSYNSLVLQNNNNYKIAIGIGGGSVGGNLQDNGYIGTISNRDLIFNTNNAERMRITSGGELLIGTTSDAGDYKLQVNGNVYSSQELYLDNGQYLRFKRNSGSLSIQTLGILSGTDDVALITTGDFYLRNGSVQNLIKVTNSGNSEFLGSIKTAAPSGGTAKPWKFGEAGVSVGGANTTAVKVEIDGVVYYLLTAYLPEPTPEPAPKPKPEG